MKELWHLCSKQTNKTLKRLFLDNTQITSESFLSVVSILKTFSALEMISLSNNNLSQASFNQLWKLAKSHLNCINLSNCWIETQALELLFDSLLLMPHLKSLNLSENHFEAAVMPNIATFLKKKTYL